MDGDLSLILGPLSATEFFNDYWEQKPLHVNRAETGHFKTLLSLGMIETLLSSQALQFPSVQLVNRNQPVAPAAYTDEAGRILPHRLIELHQDGATIVVSQAHDKIPALADFRRSIQSRIQLRCQTNVYLSPPGKQGFNAHYDSHDVFILQVSGAKTFNFYEGGIELPFAHESFESERHSCGECQQSIELTAGDTLYIPRGVMHDAVANDSTSLHITLGVYAVTKRDLVMEMMRQWTEQNMEYRQSVPGHYLQKTQLAADHQDVSILDQLQPAFSEEDLNLAMLNLADSIAIESAPDCRSLLTSRSVPELSLTSRVQINCALIMSVERHEASLRCRTHGQVLEFNDSLAEVADALLGGHKVTVADLPTGDDEQKLAVCQRLLHANLLAID